MSLRTVGAQVTCSVIMLVIRILQVQVFRGEEPSRANDVSQRWQCEPSSFFPSAACSVRLRVGCSSS